MVTVEEALTVVRKHLPKWGSARANLSEVGTGRILQDIRADRDYPPYDRVMMDGIALSWRGYEEGLREFKIAGTCAAGTPQGEIHDPSTCLEVMTGAPLPLNTDLVIPFEELKIAGGLATITGNAKCERMAFVHRKGSDARAGDVLLESGSALNGPHWGIASSVGKAFIEVMAMPRIALISTGDELVPIEEVPLNHQIRESNVHALKASLALHGYRDTILFHLRDDPSAIEEHYLKCRPQFDLMIYSGGVSKGKFDYFPSIWKRLGVTEYFHGVSQRPGKPLWFGVDHNSKLAILGLPGNPVSSLICLHRYLLSQREIYVELSEELHLKGNLTFFVPVTIEYLKSGKIRAVPKPVKNSGEFSGLSGTDGFIELPSGRDVYPAGETYLFHSWIPK